MSGFEWSQHEWGGGDLSVAVNGQRAEAPFANIPTAVGDHQDVEFGVVRAGEVGPSVWTRSTATEGGKLRVTALADNEAVGSFYTEPPVTVTLEYPVNYPPRSAEELVQYQRAVVTTGNAALAAMTALVFGR